MSYSRLDTLKDKAKKTLQRTLDGHITLAVTGLSGSGKTAFITALVHHLTEQANDKNLPFFRVMREGRHIATAQVPQKALNIPTFGYRHAIESITQEPPQWPQSTKRINTLRLAMRYRPERGLRAQLGDTATLTIDLIDYPGEWLMDLPMLNMDYATWSERQLTMLNSKVRRVHSEAFLAQLADFDSQAQVDEGQLKVLSNEYKQALTAIKAHAHAANLQPGRMLIPGELEGAPLLAFFPCPTPDEQGENTQYKQLEARFEAYKNQVVKPFYKDYFCRFDRQVVLVDLLQALKLGPDIFAEQAEAITELLAFFEYGKSNLLRRLFRPNIDKLLFVANKADQVGVNYHQDLALLLHDLVKAKANELAFAGVEVDTMAMAGVCATQSKTVSEQGRDLHCIYGKPLSEGNWLTYLPPQPPRHRLSEGQWPKQGFDYIDFAPLPGNDGKLRHMRLDHALEFLLGDKLR
ncbi:YcjX family protein [Pseudoalteromonas sp. YIC-827]|uniref:YcjX family protein n=1 Tax=Pseudoalteromonas qingdaonensis TaxID=3131913 RepID=A0ABU9MWJ0_9GAMM